MGKKTLLPLHLHYCANFFSLAPMDPMEKSGWFMLPASVVREEVWVVHASSSARVVVFFSFLKHF
jgi:hypothetical protein